ncbi:MAG: ferritin-like domain-containing protein [Epsilonproteobacteria bacterium]|nr:ferritin-like domain-containing protein [Campylobacterota bacterium]
MNFFETLCNALISDDINIKEDLVNQCFSYCTKNITIKPLDFTPIIFDKPSYFNKCNIVDPKELPKRNHLDTNDGLATLVHAITHIEYSAIDLALDAVYRFYDMPLQFKIDWLEVALDEIRHFKMLNSILEELGYRYGDFDVHQGYFDISRQTDNSVIERMAVVPRYYEASGLDVNPQIMIKLDNKRKIPVVKKIIEALHIILDEEIDHVGKGDKWFKFLCDMDNLSHGIYFEILEKYELTKKHRPHINVEARKLAGFSCDEIKQLGAKECN